jgi:hypothetical protein
MIYVDSALSQNPRVQHGFNTTFQNRANHKVAAIHPLVTPKAPKGTSDSSFLGVEPKPIAACENDVPNLDRRSITIPN